MEEEESGTVVMQIIAQGGEENLRLHDSLAVAAEGDELNEGGAPGESLLQQEQEQEGELGSPLQRSDAIGLYQEPEPLFSRDDGDIGVAHSNSSISTEMTEFADHSWREYDVGDLVLVSRDDAVRKAVILEKKAVESETNDSEEEKESDSNRTQFRYLVKYQDKEEGEEDWVDENAIAKQIEAEDDKAVINIGETPNEDDPKKKLLALSYMVLLRANRCRSVMLIHNFVDRFNRRIEHYECIFEVSGQPWLPSFRTRVLSIAFHFGLRLDFLIESQRVSVRSSRLESLYSKLTCIFD